MVQPVCTVALVLPTRRHCPACLNWNSSRVPASRLTARGSCLRRQRHNAPLLPSSIKLRLPLPSSSRLLCPLVRSSTNSATRKLTDGALGFLPSFPQKSHRFHQPVYLIQDCAVFCTCSSYRQEPIWRHQLFLRPSPPRRWVPDYRVPQPCLFPRPSGCTAASSSSQPGHFLAITSLTIPDQERHRPVRALSPRLVTQIRLSIVYDPHRPPPSA